MDGNPRKSEVYVSTILEEIFQYFDSDLCAKNPRYSSLNKLLRLKAALIAFNESGLAQSSEDQNPRSMVVPTKELMEALETKRVTTSVKPLAIPQTSNNQR